MTHTINLFDHLLGEGRRFQALGRPRDAATLYARLASFRSLPSAIAEEAQARLAELALKRKRYARARRHLTAALSHNPDLARYHFLMASAMQADDRCDPEQAFEHYTRALELAPHHVRCRCDAGLLALRLGRTDEGLALLRQAAEQAPDNPDVLGKLARGLLLAGRGDEARQALRAALFRNPRVPRLRKLWADFQMQLLRRECEARRTEAEAADEGPVLLPFVRPALSVGEDAAAPEPVRQDEPNTLAPPHQPRLLRRTRRRVQ
jgi:tetratricopeptide (TPR) repeat protein